jgi:hypothetical protein
MIPSAGAGDVEQVPLRVINLLQIGVVTYRLDAQLQRNYLVVASHNHHSERRLGASPMIVIWTLPGRFDPQQTNGRNKVTLLRNSLPISFLPSIGAYWLGYSLAVRNFFIRQETGDGSI